MTKKKKDSSQLHLFEWIKKSVDLSRQVVNPPEGSLDIDKELKAAITTDIKHATDETGKELSRADIAARMTNLTGDEVTLSMLNNWTAPSHRHGLPAKYIPAFVIATGGQRNVYETLSRNSGLFALPGPEALRSEIQKLDEQIRKFKSEKLKRHIFLKEIERGS